MILQFKAWATEWIVRLFYGGSKEYVNSRRRCPLTVLFLDLEFSRNWIGSRHVKDDDTESLEFSLQNKRDNAQRLGAEEAAWRMEPHEASAPLPVWPYVELDKEDLPKETPKEQPHRQM